MVFDGLEVNHKSFGKGVVVSLNGKYITVKFEKCQKIFVYPDVFDGFLTLADGTVPEEIRSDVNAVKAAKQVLINKKLEENRRAEKGIVIPGKENVGPEGEEEESGYKNTEEV